MGAVVPKPEPARQARPTAHRVAIVECGFVGLFAAKALRRQRVEVTIIDRTNRQVS